MLLVNIGIWIDLFYIMELNLDFYILFDIFWRNFQSDKVSWVFANWRKSKESAWYSVSRIM